MPARIIERHATRARSVLARASSARVTWLEPGAPEPHDAPSVVLDRPGAPTAATRRLAVVEIADVAPLPTRDRVRARVRLHGYAESAAPAAGQDPDERLPLRLAVRTVELETRGRTHLLRPEELRAAKADLFARRETHFLSHLATAHGDVVDALGRLASTTRWTGSPRAREVLRPSTGRPRRAPPATAARAPPQRPCCRPDLSARRLTVSRPVGPDPAQISVRWKFA